VNTPRKPRYKSRKGATPPKCGKTLRAFSTTPPGNRERGPRLIAEPKGKNEKDWAIRRKASKPVMSGQDESSTT